MANATHTDRRFNQTQDPYAVPDLQAMQEAPGYAAHLFNLVRNHLGSRVLAVGSGIGTMTQRLVESAELVVVIEPNLNCAARTREVMRGHPRFFLRVCHLEECDPAELAGHGWRYAHISKVTSHSPSQVRLFDRLVAPWAPTLELIVPPPIGLSLFGVGRRRA